MELFEKPERETILPLETAQAYAADTAKAATAITAMLGSDGWAIFTAILADRKREVQERDDYATLEDFRTDRRALAIVADLIGGLETLVEDAKAAADLFTKLAGAEGQTPRSISLSTEGKVEG
jgi:hypothetical protein